MKIRYKVYYLALAFLMFCGILNSQEVSNFEKELERLGTNVAIVIPSQAIDEYPIWSPSSDCVGANLMGKWYKANLNKVKLEKVQWRGEQIIGLVEVNSFLEEMHENEIKKFRKVSKVNTRKVKTKNGMRIELKLQGFGVSFIFKKRGEKPKILWTTDMEVCHSLVLSPNQKYVAFLSELNGLIVMKLE